MNTTRGRLSGVKRLWTKPDDIRGIEWTGKNLIEVQNFVGECRDANGKSIFAFRAYTSIDRRSFACGDLYDSEHHVWVPMEIGEWILKKGPFSYQICDPEEFAETYEEI